MLGHVLSVLGVLGVLAAGCKQSLFDNRGEPDGAGRDPIDGAIEPIDSAIVAPAICPVPCLADAAADFDGTAGGVGNRWRYLDDRRDRTWAAMAGNATKTGADPANRITTCAASPGNAACAGLPGALLIASAGASQAADPAIELTLPMSQAVQVSLRAFVATGASQQIRLYRNSREDVLFTGTASVGTTLDHAILLDALAGDRFLLAVAPSATGAEVAVQLFVNATAAVFPSTCQIAASFTVAAGNTIDNLCGIDFTHRLYDADIDNPPPLAAGPYAELGSAADLTLDAYFEGAAILDKSRDTTVQLWIKHRGFVSGFSTAWLFSDLDLNNAGGLGIALLENPAMSLDVVTTLTATPTTNTFLDLVTSYPTDGAWHFVRVVHRADTLTVCLDGVRKTSAPVPPGFLRSTFTPYLAKNVVWSPQGASLNGQLDDVRVITGALPCD